MGFPLRARPMVTIVISNVLPFGGINIPSGEMPGLGERAPVAVHGRDPLAAPEYSQIRELDFVIGEGVGE